MKALKIMKICAFVALPLLALYLFKDGNGRADVLVEGHASANFDTLTLLRVSPESFNECLLAYNNARKRDDLTARGFMRRYLAFAKLESRSVACKAGTFEIRLPPGEYIWAFPEGDYGYFLPSRVTGNTRLDFNANAATMSLE